jgi:hypothetical protein
MASQKSGDLSVLLRAVRTARSDVEDARHARPTPGSNLAAAEQRLLLSALERYVAALTSHGNPVPYRLRDEMAMYRAMFGRGPRR